MSLLFLYLYFQMSKFETEVVPPSRVRILVRFALTPRHRRYPKQPIRVALKATGVYR